MSVSGIKLMKPVQEEIAELQQRLAELSDHRRRLEEQIQQEEQQVEAEELEGSVLRSCTVAQLRDVSRALQELVTSESRAQICVSPPPSTLRSAARARVDIRTVSSYTKISTGCSLNTYGKALSRFSCVLSS